MNYDSLVQDLLEYADWADSNIYEVPITLPDVLREAGKLIQTLDAIEAPSYGPVSHAYVYGLKNSIRGAKFPLATDPAKATTELTDGIRRLAQTNPGEAHDQWLTGVVVQFDLRFSNKAWIELSRYHHIDYISSQSTMHRITHFDLDKSYNDYVDPWIVEIMKQKIEEYNAASAEDKPRLYLEILHSNPAGFELTARMTTNYRQLKTMYKQRKDHRLLEWRAFCQWIELLPESDLITGRRS